MKEMVRTRDEIAKKWLRSTVVPTVKPTREQARRIVEMGNEEKEDELKNFAAEIYATTREGQNEEGGRFADTKKQFVQRVRAALAMFTVSGDVTHVGKEEEPIDPEVKRIAKERDKERKDRNSHKRSERQRLTVVTAFRLKGQRERSQASPYPVMEARREIQSIGKAKLEYHVKAVIKELDGYGKSSGSKKSWEGRVMDITRKILELGDKQADQELDRLWSEWDKEC